jgi:uncharacterized protein involved in response to NO
MALADSQSAGSTLRTWAGPALFSFGFRPFFLFAALFAGLAVPAWLAAFALGAPLGAGGNAMAWHAHEMIFGYTGAVIAGFLLTAIPNWTGRAPVVGWPLVLLFGLWLAGRAAMALPTAPAAAAVVDSVFLLALASAVWREILSGRNWRNLPVAGMVSVFAIANILWHVEASGAPLAGLGQRLALATLAMLMALIGGRIIPSFTTNWMKKERRTPLPVPFGRFDQIVLGLTGAALVGWIAAPFALVSGVLLGLAGVGHMLRLARWGGWRTFAAPIVVILHIAYLWLAIALLLLAAAILTPGLFAGASALHALTAGAVGQLTLAVMTRASRGHSGKPLVADTATIAVYGCIFAGALLRLVLPFTLLPYATGAAIAGSVWALGMLLFAGAYGPMLWNRQLK